jgi:hypothetical protein
VYWLKEPLTRDGKTYPVGTIYIPSKPTTKAVLDTLAKEVGLTFEATATPAADAVQSTR